MRLQVFAGVREALICIRKESEIANQSRAMAEEENGSVAKPRAKVVFRDERPYALGQVHVCINL